MPVRFHGLKFIKYFVESCDPKEWQVLLGDYHPTVNK
jgi:hypothetical protein